MNGCQGDKGRKKRNVTICNAHTIIPIPVRQECSEPEVSWCYFQGLCCIVKIDGKHWKRKYSNHVASLYQNFIFSISVASKSLTLVKMGDDDADNANQDTKDQLFSRRSKGNQFSSLL